MTTSVHPAPTAVPRRHSLVAGAAGFLAANAWYGAVGLATGGLTIGPELTERLPFGSAVLGGVALALVIAVPATALTVVAVRGTSRPLGPPTFALGYVLVAWILVELAFVRELSFLHPVLLAYGVALMVLSRQGGRHHEGA